VEASCKRTLEIAVPVETVEQETGRVIEALKQRVRLPGFRPGKAPSGLVRSRFAAEIREDVIKSLVPKHFHKAVEDQDLHVVGTPDITDVHFHAGEPLKFKAEFEVAPDFELKDYLGLTVAYREPEVTGEQVAERLERLREQKAEFVNVDPRPVADGDYAVISLEAVGPAAEGIGKQDELTVHIGGEDTLEAFSTNLRGGTPGEEKEFDVRYPEDYGDPKLGGQTVRFRVNLKGIRRKELPELNDAFAADAGDFKSLEELRDEIRKSLQRETEFVASQEAKKKLVDQLVDMHEFPVPEAFLERQIEMQVEQYLRSLAARGEDLSKVKLDWEKIRESQRERAGRDVKASLLLERIADRETIEVTNEEMDRELQRIARQGREPLAAVRKRLEEDGGLRRIASRIRTDKTLNLLFEQSRKVAQD
jgi:trigger factor